MRKEYDFSKLKELKNPYSRKKKAVGINLSPEVVDYFKRLAVIAQAKYGSRQTDGAEAFSPAGVIRCRYANSIALARPSR